MMILMLTSILKAHKRLPRGQAQPVTAAQGLRRGLPMGARSSVPSSPRPPPCPCMQGVLGRPKEKWLLLTDLMGVLEKQQAVDAAISYVPPSPPHTHGASTTPTLALHIDTHRRTTFVALARRVRLKAVSCP